MRPAALALLVLLAVGPALAVERQEPLPDELEGVGVTEHLDATVPLGASFKDENGHPVQLREYFQEGTPVVLVLGYYRCPMLCGLVFNGVRDAVKESGLAPGADFRLVTLSIDPNETPSLAAAKKANYMESLDMPGADWHFLTGTEAEIRAVADALGFGYRWVAERNEYAHPAVLHVLTPEGRISRYLYGVQHEARTFRLSLVEASEGRIGTATDKILLYCFHYDPQSRAYAVAAARLAMRIGGALTVLALGAVLAGFWVREARRKRVA